MTDKFHAIKADIHMSHLAENLIDYLMVNSYKLLYIKRSNIFPHIARNETGR